MTTRKKATAKPSAKDMIKAARLPEQMVPLCLRGDLLSAYQAAETELNIALLPSDSLAGSTADTEALAEKVEALRTEMADYTLELTLRALPRLKWKAFESAHPPRMGEDGRVIEDDRRFGFDVSTFFPEVLPVSTASPELDAEDWTALLTEKLTDGQIESLCTAVWLLNQGQVSVPFSVAASRTLSSSGKK